MTSRAIEVKDSLLEAIKNGNLKKVVKTINFHGLSFCADLFDGYILLCKAIEFGQLKIANFLLEKGAKVNGESASSPLHLAVEERSLVLVQSLIQRGAEINCLRLRDNYTPLHIACGKNCDDIVFKLLSSGADPKIKAYDDSTPLHLAARGVSSVIELLIEHGAEVNCRRLSDKYTPLHIACEKKAIKCVDALLKSGADVNAEAIDRTTPLLIAIQEGSLEIIERLLKHDAEVNYSRLSDKYTPLHIACEKKTFECFSALLKSGANANAEAIDGITPLVIAVREQSLDIVEALIKHGVQISFSRPSDNRTPLHIACETSSPDIVECLLNSGADPNFKANANVTPLHLAAAYSSGTAEPLLRHGAQINCQRLPDNYSPLHIACEKGCIDEVDSLLNQGADPNILAKSNVLPIHLAVKNDHVKIVESLLKHGTKLNCSTCEEPDFTPLHYACLEESCGYRMVEVLLQSGAEPNVKTSDDVTPFHVAVQGPFISDDDYTGFRVRHAVGLLAEYGGRVNCTRFSDNYTPLHVACEAENDPAVEALLNHGADPHFKANGNVTPLHLAVVDAPEVTRWLLKLGVEVDCRRLPDNYTPLHVACKGGCGTAVCLLLHHGADPNARTADDSTPFHLVMERSHMSIMSTLMKHLIKLNVATLYLSEDVLHLLQLHKPLWSTSFFGRLDDLEVNCEVEVVRMKSKQVTNQSTLYDVLINQGNSVYARNDSLMESLVSCIDGEFSAYQGLLLSCIEKGKKRIELLTSGAKWLDVILKSSNILNGNRFRNLPVELLEEIVSYLNNKELSSLSACGEDLKFQICNGNYLFS